MSNFSKNYTFQNISKFSLNCLYEVGQVDKITSEEKLQNTKAVF